MTRDAPRRLIDYLRLSTEYLASKGIETARLDAEVLLAHVLGKDRVYLYVNFDQPLEAHEVDAYRELLVQRARGVPVAYLTGVKEFYSREFSVAPGVLIPRPETEILVEEVLSWSRRRGGELQIADIGTGSGVLAITLALELPGARVWATDVSPKALEIAEENARRLGATGRVHLLSGPWLQPLAGLTFDVLISNPPYIPSAEIEQLEPEVRIHEPRTALDGGVDGLAAYRELIPQASKYVRPGGLMAVEIGAGQAEAVSELACDADWDEVRVVKDLAGIERVVLMQRS